MSQLGYNTCHTMLKSVEITTENMKCERDLWDMWNNMLKYSKVINSSRVYLYWKGTPEIIREDEPTLLASFPKSVKLLY